MRRPLPFLPALPSLAALPASLPPLPRLESLILAFDRSLRTLATQAQASRPYPAASLPEDAVPAANDATAAGGTAVCTDASRTPRRPGPPALPRRTGRQHAASLMRVNHTGEVCAQALYQGQALFARTAETRALLLDAAREEWDHLGWCQRRLTELDSRPSLLNPVWYAGSFALGAASAIAGDRWNMAFLVETERQVEHHLAGHLQRLPKDDVRSRAIVAAMAEEEAQHAAAGLAHGAARLPAPVRAVMRGTARLMTGTSYWL